MLTGLWAIRSDFEQDSDKACDFFIGAIMGMAMIAAKAEYEERERILSTNTYYASEFAGLDDDGNFVDPQRNSSSQNHLWTFRSDVTVQQGKTVS